MSAETPYTDQDKDALHILPLSVVPLATPGLSKAKLIKNARLEGVIELFSGEEIGSGQIAPSDLDRVFHFDSSNERDLDLVMNLSELASYDVFSLRIELRKLDIEVDECEHLQLSSKKVENLNKYMRVFTRPLIATIYGGKQSVKGDFKDIVGLFIEPSMPEAQKNLAELATALDIDVRGIPKFLEDYGDAYLSLAYYQSCLDENLPIIHDFLKSVAEIQKDPNFKSNPSIMGALNVVESKLKGAVSDVENVLEIFRARTLNMWYDINAESYRKIKELMTGYHTDIGKALCAITVKMSAWKEKFPRKDNSGTYRRADFIMSEIRHGIDSIHQLNYSDI